MNEFGLGFDLDIKTLIKIFYGKCCMVRVVESDSEEGLVKGLKLKVAGDDEFPLG